MNYYCDCINCKNAKWSTSGDGWNEPMENDFDCDEIENIGLEHEYTENKNDEPCPKFIPVGEIKNVNDLAKEIGIEVEGIKKSIYKYTNCGAWIELKHGKIQMGSIVEGVDFGTQTYTLEYPFSAKEFWGTLESIEHEAEEIWNDTHGCEDCGEEGEYGYIAINPNCKTCNGEGEII